MNQLTQSVVYIALGSNLSKPEQQLRDAIEKLRMSAGITLLQLSHFYQSSALTLPGSAPQADYINAVAKLSTELNPQQLLRSLHAIEDSQGRQRKAKWAARTLDLDILLYADRQLQTADLSIPHPQMIHRNFVIHPLYEIAGDIDLPGIGRLSDLSALLSWQGLKQLDTDPQ